MNSDMRKVIIDAQIEGLCKAKDFLPEDFIRRVAPDIIDLLITNILRSYGIFLPNLHLASLCEQLSEQVIIKLLEAYHHECENRDL